MAPTFGVTFLKGCFSLKNLPQRVLLKHNTTPFKDTCFLIYSKEVPFALYGPHLKRYKPVPTYLMKRTVGKFAVIARIGAKF
jgi:hypothetical protein